MTSSLREINGDAFRLLANGTYDAACVTTNGITRNNGWAVMGAGVAKACANTHPESPRLLGELLRQNGNITQVILDTPAGPVIAFPTKHHWRDASDLSLIQQSCRQLMQLINARGLTRVLLPKPGCANGGLYWHDVRAAITPLLDERVVIISR